jgi:hydroxyacid-oxoacid transhydrogenase
VRNVQLKFGEGVSLEVGYEAKRLNMTNMLLVTDNNISKNTGIPAHIVSCLEDQRLNVDIFDGVHIEPVDNEVIKGIEYAKKKEYDGFIGLGGGSSIDTAKMINLYTTHPTINFKDYISPPIGRGKRIPGKLKPLIAIPTTAGTGSENTPVAIVDLIKEKIKVAISHPYLLPTYSLLDPLLTISLPPQYTASTGMDTLLHSIECYTCIRYNARQRPSSPEKRPVYTGSNPVSDIFVEKSIELIGKYLRRAYYSPHDLEARHFMLLAAHLGGAFGNAGVHIPHALAYPIAGRRHELSHGITVSMTAPASLDYIKPVVEERLVKIAKLLGEKTDGKSTDEAATLAQVAIIKLMKDLTLPSGVAACGFEESDINELAEAGIKLRRLLSCSPRTVKLDDVKEIYKKSLYNW